MAHDFKIDDRLLNELSRVGAWGRFLDDERNLHVREVGDDLVALEEPGFRWLGPRDEALLRLAKLESSAGGHAFQEAFRHPRRVES